MDAGRYRDALASIEGVLATPAQTDDSWHARAHGLRALIYGHLGQRHLAARCQAEAGRYPSLPMSIPANAVTRVELDWILEAPVDETIEQGRAEIAKVGTPSDHWRLALARALARPESIDARAMESLHRAATDQGLLGHALAARLAMALAAGRRGDAEGCVESARAALQSMRGYTLPGCYRPRLWLICHDLLQAFDLDLADRALRDGLDWIHAVARFHVPESFREGFLHRNPVNRALRLAADTSAAGR